MAKHSGKRRTHDLTAARTHGIIDALAEADIKCWADSDDG